ncbi:MAG: rod shape-determining protein MreC [Erysipelotrichales bacterium]|nr:rod shape-determining protein MreC [Erysipelotrichales bacterium]
MKLDIFKKFLLSFIILLILIFTIMFGLKSNPLTNHYRFVGYDFITSAKYYLFEKPTKSFTDTIDSFSNYEDTTRELELMQEYIEQIAMMNELYKEVKSENEELKSLLDMKNTATEFNTRTANVISRDADGWNNYITIDLGSDDNIRENQAVVSSKGLIGKIFMVSNSTSVVKLITSEDGLSKVALKINQANAVEAILESYDAEKHYLILRVLDNNTDIEIGSNVVTSALGGVYPNGILVGTVEEVNSVNYMLGKIVYVKPAADFKVFSKVNVIERKMQEVAEDE